MVPVNRSPTKTGAYIGRTRWQKGWIEATGKKVKKWKGHYYVYVRHLDGKEERSHRAVVLGLRSEMRKTDAEKKLKEIIDRNNRTDQPGRLTPDCTLRWFWDNRYRPLKEPLWKISSRPKTVRFFGNYVLPAFGHVPLDKLNPLRYSDASQPTRSEVLVQRGFQASDLHESHA